MLAKSLILLVGALWASGCGSDDGAPGPDVGVGRDVGRVDQGMVDVATPRDGASPDGRATDSVTPDGATPDGPAVDAGAASCGFDPLVEYSFRGEIWQLVSSDEKTCVRLQRRDDSQPGWIYKAVPYTALSMTVGYQGRSETVSDADKLSYESTHHNWNDAAEARGQTVRYRLELRYDGLQGQTFSVQGLQLDADVVVWGPIALEPYVP